MLSSEFLVELAEKVYGTLSSLEGTLRPLQGEEGATFSTGGGISAPHVLAGLSSEEGPCFFVKTLTELMEERGVGDAEVSSRVGWTPEDMVALRAEGQCRPVKEQIFAFGLALELERDEMLRLLASAGYALSEDEVYDIVLLHCLDKGVFGLEDVNEALECFNLKPIVLRPWRGRPTWGPGPDGPST